MRKTVDLVQLNKEKRELLLPDNKQLYEEFVVYIRSDLRIDDQAAEELLMDLLDHLLDAQREGGSGKALFGNYPKQYADELIAALPTEKKRDVLFFVTSQVFMLLSLFSLINGAVLLLLPFITPIKVRFFLGSGLLQIGFILFIIAVCVIMIFKVIRESIFRDRRNKVKAYLLSGGIGAVLFALSFAAGKAIPSFGPEVTFHWWFYFLLGAVLYMAKKVIDRTQDKRAAL
ncbi:DUF1129 family protein [Bacillus sp. 1P06AnD]|uniref:DUF1129 family protein n=1 Tax=Bacillus sp. 1P06AnD TaxID=3132208 RepID=UPI0039A0809A